MKLARLDNDQLVLTDGAAPIRGIGAFLIAFGGLWLFAGNRGAALTVVPLVIGALAALGGVLLIVLPGRVTAAFDRPSRTLVITRRSLRGRTHDEVDLAKIATVEAEPSQGTRGMTTWRVAVVLQNGTRVPLTTWYSNSPSHAAAAKAAREFLSLPEPPAPAVASPIDAAAAALPAIRPIGKGIFAAFGVMAAVFMGIGAMTLYREAHLLQVAVAVPAVVLSSHTEYKRSTGRNSTATWLPVVTYRYEVDGRSYTSSRVTTLNESRSGNWADKLIARYPVGATVTAWYDPAQPARAFLLHEWSLLPLFFIAFPLLILIFLATIARRLARARGSLPG